MVVTAGSSGLDEPIFLGLRFFEADLAGSRWGKTHRGAGGVLRFEKDPIAEKIRRGERASAYGHRGLRSPSEKSPVDRNFRARIVARNSLFPRPFFMRSKAEHDIFLRIGDLVDDPDRNAPFFGRVDGFIAEESMLSGRARGGVPSLESVVFSPHRGAAEKPAAGDGSHPRADRGRRRCGRWKAIASARSAGAGVDV